MAPPSMPLYFIHGRSLPAQEGRACSIALPRPFWEIGVKSNPGGLKLFLCNHFAFFFNKVHIDLSMRGYPGRGKNAGLRW